MNIKELKALKKKIQELSGQLEAAESVNAGNGAITSEISDVENDLRSLQAEWDNAIGRLSYDDDTANCIYLHYAAGYTWQQIANLTDGIPDTAAGIRMRCRRYRW